MKREIKECDNQVEVEEYISDGEVQIRWANGILIFCTPKGKEILEDCLKSKTP